METATRTNTKHAPSCRMSFGRLDPMNCVRCQELLCGERPRSWSRQRRYAPAFNSEAYCFCPGTSLAADRCEKCGKRPFRD